jgi:hypothetical protein
MARGDPPTDIEHFLARSVPYSCCESRSVKYRQESLRKRVTEFANAQDDGWRLLHDAALSQLADADPKLVDRALAVLFVVGSESDSAAIEPLLSHRDPAIKSAATTCLFELRHRRTDSA